MEKRNKTLKLALTGVMTALTIVVTWILPIPMVSTEGYINFGDAVIFIAAVTMGGVPAMIVGGIGSMLADILAGYTHWALFTLIIKGLEGLICGLIFKAMRRFDKRVAMLPSMIVSALWMVAAYYLAGALMYGWAGSLASVPGNLLQGGVSVGVGFALMLIIDHIRPLKGIFDRLK